MGVDETSNTALVDEVFYFLEAVREDNRISPVHISLFIAIAQQWRNKDCSNAICILTREIMQLSKISGRATYYRCLKELHEYGYIRYSPSHDCLTGTFVHLACFHRT